MPEAVLDGIKFHHEDWEGGGYPCGLKKDGIPLIAQVLHIADVFDAVVAARAYHRGRSQNEALRTMSKNQRRDGNGREFNPDFLKTFLRLFDDKTIQVTRPRTGGTKYVIKGEMQNEYPC